MADVIYPDGTGITALEDSDLEANDAYIMANTSTKTPATALYSEIKKGIIWNPGDIGDDTGATSIKFCESSLTNEGELWMTPYTGTATLTGASTTISFDFTGKIIGSSYRVDVAVTDDGGDDTWSAAYSGGNTTSIVSGAAAAKNTRASVLFDVNAASNLAPTATGVTFTPNGGNFTAGEITVVVYFWSLNKLDLI